ncbi:MAG: MFS transporter [Microbacteriaceae bacterium]
MATPKKQISQRKVLSILISGQILAGLGVGINVTGGSILIAQVSGDEGMSGLAVTVAFLGAALVSVPLARIADKHGRRFGLGLGMAIAAVGAIVGLYGTSINSLWLILLAFTMLGAAAASTLQSRFAATDLSLAKHRGRDLSIIVWSGVIGSVIGPNMVPIGMEIGQSMGLPGMTGIFLPPLAGQLLASAIFFIFLRPDPLIQARQMLATARENQPKSAPAYAGNMKIVIFAMTSIALSQFVMNGLMAMTPMHLLHHGGDITIIGITISLHIAGMYGISPLFGIMSDKIGAIPTIIFGQAQLLASMLIVILWAENQNLLMVSLVLLGTGWSAASVAGSVLITQYSPTKIRVKLQGRSDMFTNIAGASGPALSGLLFTQIGFIGLAWILMIPIAIICIYTMQIRGVSKATEAPSPEELL